MSSERPAKLINLLLLLGPFFGFLLVFWLIPLFFGVDLSLQSREHSMGYSEPAPVQSWQPGMSFDDIVSAPEEPVEKYVGSSNYSKVWKDVKFHKALRNTAKYTFAVISVVLPLAFVLALLIRNSFRFARPALSLTLLLPALTLPAVLATLFHLVFHGRHGILNQVVITPLGFEAINWQLDPAFILSAVVLQAVWRWTGFITLFYLCAMEAIPKVQYEAARLEGSGWWRTLGTVTLPGVRHVGVFAGIFLGVDAIASYAGAYSLHGPSGGTLDAGLLMVPYVYQLGSASGGQLDYPAAAAATLMVAPVMALIAWLVLTASKRRETSA